MEIILIAAMSANRVIGKNNKIPWHIPAELAIFKKKTVGYPVIMGRKTHQSIGRPLAGRKNIILTRNRKLNFEGCHCAGTIQEALSFCEGSKKVFVLGGEQIFLQMLPVADRIELTLVDKKFEGDTFFALFSDKNFHHVETIHYKGPQPFSILSYVRIG